MLGGVDGGGYSIDNLSQSQASFARGDLVGDRRKRLAEDFLGGGRDARDRDDDHYWRRRIGDERNREMGREIERGRDGERDFGRDTELERARGDYERDRAVGRELGCDIRREVAVERGHTDDHTGGMSSREGDGSVNRDANNRPIPEFIMRAQNEE